MNKKIEKILTIILCLAIISIVLPVAGTMENSKNEVVNGKIVGRDISNEWVAESSGSKWPDYWAVLVCGSDNYSGGFQNDISDMYNLLDTELHYGHKYKNEPYGRIHYVAPKNWNSANHYYSLSRANIIKAINDVKNNSNFEKEDYFFFYYTAHGTTDSLDADADGKAGGTGDISAQTLSSALSFQCKQVVVLQGCYTGSFINDLSGVNYRVVITATNDKTKAWEDMYGKGHGDPFWDPNGPNDDWNPPKNITNKKNTSCRDGSEFSSGFRDAFRCRQPQRPNADQLSYPGNNTYNAVGPHGNQDTLISVTEAFDYAKFEDCYSTYWSQASSYITEYPQIWSKNSDIPKHYFIAPFLAFDPTNFPPSDAERPEGPISGYANVTYTYYTRATDPDNHKIRYYFDWGDATGSWTELKPSGIYASISHSWSRNGTYSIQAIPQDENGSLGGWSDTLTVNILPNKPPNRPDRPSGPTSGYTGTSYTYSSSTTDHDGDQIYYLFDWDDGTNSGWLGLYNSGATASASHAWSAEGTYNIKVKAKDVYDAESNWSDPLEVVIEVSDIIPPEIEITKPKEGYLYLADRELLPMPITLVIGRITIAADAGDEESGMSRVEFYIDDELRSTCYMEPYNWLWDEAVFGRRNLKVMAYDNAGNSATDEIEIWIFNIG